MNSLRKLTHRLLAVLLLTPCGAAWAQWELDSEHSAVNFVSIKNDAVGEVHGFGSLVGYIGADGAAQLTIDLGSVQTQIDIRDERMRELLFETVKFPSASITARADPALLAAAAEGATLTAEVPVTLSLHGREQTLNAPLVLVGEKGGALRVFSARPLLVNAADFGLEAGVEALRAVAGLKTISGAVPVTLHLTFTPAR